MRTVATQVVGVAGVDNRGLEGIEYRYDKELSGSAGGEVVVRDPVGRDLKIVKAAEPRPGVTVRLTIDQAIQFTAEQVLATTVRQYRARGATAIVENPRTGEIYAMANVPLVDGNHLAGTNEEDLRNKAVTTIYEPGSTFKTITVAGCLEDRLVRPQSRFLIPASLRVADRTIHEAHEHPTQWFTVRRILAESSNVGAVKQKQSFTLQVLDDEVNKAIEKCRKVTDLMELLTYQLSQGNRWIPGAAKGLLDRELQSRTSRGRRR
jgi:cell division protein FtsI/penicillin-binding protein 2